MQSESRVSVWVRDIHIHMILRHRHRHRRSSSCSRDDDAWCDFSTGGKVFVYSVELFSRQTNLLLESTLHSPHQSSSVRACPNSLASGLRAVIFLILTGCNIAHVCSACFRYAYVLCCVCFARSSLSCVELWLGVNGKFPASPLHSE